MKKMILALTAFALLAALPSAPALAQEQPARDRGGDSAPSPPPPPPPPSASAPSAPSASSGGGDHGGFRGGRGGDDGGGFRGARGGRNGSGDTRSAAPRGRVEPSHVGGSVEGADRSENRGSPNYSRPRGDRTVVGEAVPRGTVPTRGRPGSGGGGTSYIFDPYYGYYGGGYGGWYGGSRYNYLNHYGWPYYWGAFGLGYFYYDPFWWSYPYYGGYAGMPPDYAGYGGYSGGGGYVAETGGLRLKVKPRHAKVYVNGYFEGYVDNFDGILQKMKLRPGPNRIEVRADGFEPIVFDVNSFPGETITYKADMRPMP
jgi:hypothetical protein